MKMTPTEQKEILSAIESGKTLSRSQLLNLITFEAEQSGLDLDELRDRARRRVPPHDTFEGDARLLLSML